MAGNRLKLDDEALLPLGLGTVKLGRNTDVKYPSAYELPSDAEAEALLEGAFELGVRLFDTAPAYGEAERRLRGFVRRHRDEILICSKAGEEYGPTGSRFDFSPQALRNSCERSLERLGVDALDYLLLHSDGQDERWLQDEALMECLADLRDCGRARAVGISAKTEQGVLLASASLDLVMAPYGLHDQRLGESLARAHDHGCTIFAIKTLASGHADPAQALQHVFEQDFVDAVIVGSLRLDHVQQAVAQALRSMR